jgi:hypothetical protein
MQRADTDSIAERARCVGPRTILALAVLAVSAAAVAQEDPPARDDDVAPARESAANDDARQAAQGSRREQRRHGKPTDADEVQASDRAAPVVLPADPETRIVCRSYRRLGTRIDRRVCATAAEWAQREAAAEREADRFTRELSEASSIVPPGDITPGRTPL